MTRVKICGVTREEDVQTVVDAGADAVGVISDVTVETPRAVDPDRAAELITQVPPFVTSVLVTMPTDPARAIELISDVEPDAVQIHGDLSPSDLEAVKTATGVQVLLSVDARDIDAAQPYDDVVDGFLVDSMDEDGGGGTGQTHDWERTRAETSELDAPAILAGGLTPDNVEDAVQTVTPYGVDVASGVETRGGVKDSDAVTAFVEQATRAEDSRPVDSGL